MRCRLHSCQFPLLSAVKCGVHTWHGGELIRDRFMMTDRSTKPLWCSLSGLATSKKGTSGWSSRNCLILCFHWKGMAAVLGNSPNLPLLRSLLALAPSWSPPSYAVYVWNAIEMVAAALVASQLMTSQWAVDCRQIKSWKQTTDVQCFALWRGGDKTRFTVFTERYYLQQDEVGQNPHFYFRSKTLVVS